MLTPDMKRIVEEQRLGFVATAGADGTPNLSPKGTFVVLDDQDDRLRRVPLTQNHPQSARQSARRGELRRSVRAQGLPLRGHGHDVERGDDGFDALLGRFRGAFAVRMRALVTVTVTKALPLTSPAYDDGKTELELRRAWTARFRALQPNQQFEE
jgi:uncharacterized protein